MRVAANGGREKWKLCEISGVVHAFLLQSPSLAAGSFGSIHLAMWMNTQVAVKMPSDDLNDKALDDFMCEVELMRYDPTPV
jgi:hypothetical protein